jgi:PPK2 family polyphosphate:nucleotide phosphotransferase
MKKSDLERVEKFIRPYRVTKGKDFRLKDHDPADTGRLTSADKDEAKQVLSDGVEWMAEQQDMLYAQDHWGLLLVFQAMDAAGKDSAIKHVTSGINPQGCSVRAFKQPSSEELDHDFLWRYHEHVPARGQIGIFNRSYYEEVLVVRVHEELLKAQKIPPQRIGKKIWDERYQDVRNFESYLDRNGIVVVKFFLNVSKAEQKRRFIARLDEPEKNWKFAAADVDERQHWRDYMKAYEDTIRETATPESPWYVVPADNKWFSRLVVAGAMVDALANLGLQYPVVDDTKRKALAGARKRLESE